MAENVKQKSILKGCLIFIISSFALSFIICHFIIKSGSSDQKIPKVSQAESNDLFNTIQKIIPSLLKNWYIEKDGVGVAVISDGWYHLQQYEQKRLGESICKFYLDLLKKKGYQPSGPDIVMVRLEDIFSKTLALTSYNSTLGFDTTIY
jgi:hypothetical protein